jgi:hypothetical protein
MGGRICECGHVESKHVTGRCTVEVPIEGKPVLAFCGCKRFKPKREDLSQAAARIVKEAAED